MIKQSVKNYFKCLKYIFTPLGVLALGVMIGLSILIPGVISSVSEMTDKIAQASDKAIDLSVMLDGFVDAVRELDWSDTVGAVKQMFSESWLYEVFSENLDTLVGDIEVFTTAVSDAITMCVSKIAVYFAVLVVFTVIGFLAGFLLTKRFIRLDIAKRRFYKFLINATVDAVLTGTAVAFCVWITSLWLPGLFISAAVTYILSAFISLTEAYITHGFKKVPFKKIVNIKNAAKLLLADLIIFVIAVTFVTVITVMTNAVIGLFVAMGFTDVTVAVMTLNAEAYVKVFAAAPQTETETENHSVGDTAVDVTASHSLGSTPLSETACSALAVDPDSHAENIV